MDKREKRGFAIIMTLTGVLAAIIGITVYLQSITWDIRPAPLSNREWAILSSGGGSGSFLELRPGRYQINFHHYSQDQRIQSQLLVEELVIEEKDTLLAIYTSDVRVSTVPPEEERWIWQLKLIGDDPQLLGPPVETDFFPNSFYQPEGGITLTPGQEQAMGVIVHTHIFPSSWQRDLFAIDTFSDTLELLDMSPYLPNPGNEDLSHLRFEFIFFTITSLE